MSGSIPANTLDRFTTFGDLLRFLRRRAGLTQLELSIAVGYSDAQISRLEQNLRLPDIPTIEARFVDALALEDEPRAVARLLDLAAQVRREDAPGLGLCPYKGLSYFDEVDADLFVGREALTARLVDRVLSLTADGEPGEKLLAVVGASGSGKSSLVRAGLIPALRWHKTTANWPIHLLTPTAHPLESLAASLTADTASLVATTTLIDDLVQDPRSLSLFIRRALRTARASHLLLVVDQFEELFALCRSEEERSLFVDNLLTATAQPDGPAIAVITLRADFYACCAGYPRLREALARRQEYIGAMNDDELRRAIEEPARRGRWECEPGLVDLVLHDVGHEPGALPLLSHALLETWQRRRGRTLTLGGYTSTGGVRGAIAETAEAVFADQLSREQQTIARRIFMRLTEPGDDTVAVDTRRRVAFDELITDPEGAAATEAVLKALVDARLITTTENAAEVAHEALIREWPTLQGWLAEGREALRLHHQLTEAAQQWLSSQRDPDILYRGARLAQAREWAAAHDDEMNPYEREFLGVSVATAEQEAAEREARRVRELEAAQRLAEAESARAEEGIRTARQLRRRAIHLAAALVIALAMAATALFFGGQARRAALSAQSQGRVALSRELAVAAIGNLGVDPERSILLALEAISVTYTVDGRWTAEAEDALHQALAASRAEHTLRGHTDRVWAAAFSPDGHQVATAGDDGTLRLWDAATGAVLLTLPSGATRGRHGLAWGSACAAGRDMPVEGCGAWLATAGAMGAATVWDAATGEALLTVRGHTDWVSAVAFSPDCPAGVDRPAECALRLATAGEDRTARVWDMATGDMLLVLQGHTGEVWDVAWSPDGRLLATAGEDGTVRVWDATTGEIVQVLMGHTGPVGAVAWRPACAGQAPGSPDTPAGQCDLRLAMAGQDRTVRVWDVATGRQLLALQGHTGAIWDIAWSPDGRRLASASSDAEARVWDATTGEPLFGLNGHTGPVAGVAFSPDCAGEHEEPPAMCGTRLVTAGWDGTARLWNGSFSRELLTLSLAGATAGALTAGCAPESRAPADQCGPRVAVGREDGTIAVWELAGAIREAARGAGGVMSAAMILHGATGPVTALAFDPGCVGDLLAADAGRGVRLASGGEDGTVRVWDLATGAELLSLPAHAGGVYHLAFSPNGERLVSVSIDYTAKVWDLAAGSGGPLYTISTPSWINAAVFSPDGTRLATALDDATAKVWDAVTGEELLVLRGHADGVFDIAWSPDCAILSGPAAEACSPRLATASDDGTAKIWDATTGELLLTLQGHVGWVNGVAWSPTCLRVAGVVGPECRLQVATAGQDGTARLWDADTGRLSLTLRGHTGGLAGLALGGVCNVGAASPSADASAGLCGGYLLTAGADDRTVRAYPLDIADLVALGHARLTRSLTAAECQGYLHRSADECPAESVTRTPAGDDVPARTALGARGAAGRVCEVTDEAGVEDQFFNQLAYQGVRAAAERFGWESMVSEARQPGDYERHIEEFIQAGCDLIVLPTGVFFVDAVQALAEANPDRRFQIADWTYDPPLPNVWGQLHAIDQAAFLAGYLAAAVSNTGAVGTYGGVNFEGVTDLMDGFALGVAHYNQRHGAGVQVLGWDVATRDGLFTGTFVNPEEGRRMGELLLDQGADIILPVAGETGLGTAVAVAARGGAYIIGVDTDWAITYPEYAPVILTSVQKRLDVGVIAAVEAIIDGRFVGGAHVGTLENGGVGLAPFHTLTPSVTPELQADLAQITAGIIAGEIPTMP